LPIEGTWIANYASRAHGSFTEVGNEAEKATLVLENGQVTGHDPQGRMYEGNYSLSRAMLQMTLKITTDTVMTGSIFGLPLPLNLNLRGHYSRPSFISLNSQVVGSHFEMVLNCRRQK
jgi:hypothetical protein